MPPESSTDPSKSNRPRAGRDRSGAAVDDLLAAARERISPRPTPAQMAALVVSGALVVDIRPADQRQRDGALPGALVIDRNVLEWRLDPTSSHRCPEAEDLGPGSRIVLVCADGYASSLAATTLRDLGLTGATDLDGGYRAWRDQQGGASYS